MLQPLAKLTKYFIIARVIDLKFQLESKPVSCPANEDMVF